MPYIKLHLLNLEGSEIARNHLLELAIGPVDERTISKLWEQGGVWTFVSVSKFDEQQISILEMLSQAFLRYQYQVDLQPGSPDGGSKEKYTVEGFEHRSAMPGDIVEIIFPGERKELWLCCNVGWLHLSELDSYQFDPNEEYP